MKEFAILGDTSADLDFKLADRFDLYILPYSITLNGNPYRDLIDISSREVYHAMKGPIDFKTAVPPLENARELIQKIIDDGYKKIIMIASSARITGMINMMNTVRNYFPEIDICIIDSRSCGMGTGIQLVYASQLREAGLTMEDTINKLKDNRKNLKVLALLRTFKYVVKSGRIGKVKGKLGQLLNIYPLLDEKDGKIIVREKLRGKKQSLKRVATCTKEMLKNKDNYYMSIFSADNEEEKSILRDLLSEEIKNAKIYLETELTSVLGGHVGPKTIGVSLYLLS
ncbi:MAG: DegV family protein [Tissierellia bacterium]|nr:DegV family protein [Tissierellia bacterium]